MRAVAGLDSALEVCHQLFKLFNSGCVCVNVDDISFWFSHYAQQDSLPVL